MLIRERTMARGPILVTGRSGTLGRAFARACDERDMAYVLTSRQDLDIADETSVKKALTEMKPSVVVNTAGYVRVDAAEQDLDNCFRENARGPAILGRFTSELGIPLVIFSSDLVFDGRSAVPYRETDRPASLSVYGLSKLAAESAVAACERALVIRTAAFFSAHDGHNFIADALRRLARGEVVDAYNDATVSPTYVPDLVAATLNLLSQGATGIWHIANTGCRTWYELASFAAALGGYDHAFVRAVPRPEYIPRYSALVSERGLRLPDLEQALMRCTDAIWRAREKNDAYA
jgi:dTDP-4-dehydrorhamnose reductase